MHLVVTMGVVVPHHGRTVVEAPGVLVIEPEGLAPVDVGIPLVERTTVARVALAGEVRVGPHANTEVAKVGRDVEVDFKIALQRRLGVEERTIELIARIDTIVAEAPDEGGIFRFVELGLGLS